MPHTKATLEQAYENLSYEQKLNIDEQVRRLTMYPGMGRTSALEILMVLGKFLEDRGQLYYICGKSCCKENEFLNI